MAYDLVVGGERQVDLATINGWKRFRQWAEKFSESDYPQLAHFISENWSQELSELSSEIKKAIKSKRPTADVLDIANVIAGEINSAPEDAASIFVTDGLTPDDIDDDWEQASESSADDIDSKTAGSDKLQTAIAEIWSDYP